MNGQGLVPAGGWAGETGSVASFRVKTRRREISNEGASTSLFRADVRLTGGEVAVGDPIQVEGSDPPVRGTVESLWARSGEPVVRVTKRGLGGTPFAIAVFGFGPADVPRGADLVPAPAVPAPAVPAPGRPARVVPRDAAVQAVAQVLVDDISSLLRSAPQAVRSAIRAHGRVSS